MKRKRLTLARRMQILAAHSRTCCICGLSIEWNNPWIVEHITPLSMGGTYDWDNMAPAHAFCAKKKTAAEAGPRAKADRQRARHLGVKKSSPRPMPGTKASKWRKRLDGTVERRR
jgi:5-methylcytosine-specific restriction enzyme A